ncbi:MAG TPA: hypothetical protein VFA43_01630 [Gemmatimonadaceae bacterium]|nr:hypothetical protein [Gemmatimonadaceae bacterium]
MLLLCLQLALIDSAQHAMHMAPARTVRVVGIQHTFLLGNAERADGPWRTLYARFEAQYDAAHGQVRIATQPLSVGFGGTQVAVISDSVMAVNGSGGSATSYEDWIDRINASPERALALAAASPGLRVVGTKQRYGLTFDVVEFPWRNGHMRLELERETHLPDVVEIVRTYPKDFRRAPFGENIVRFEYVDWNIHPGGWWWPMQHKVSLNGEPLRDVTIDTVAVSDDAVSTDIPDSARAQYAANLRRAPDAIRIGTTAPPSEIAPGILRIPELWSMTVIKQDDGIVIFEAHQSAQFLHDVIDTARAHYPGLPIKALVMTSDPWAHLGGVSEAVKLGLPIYVNSRSIPFLTSLVKRPAKFLPVRVATTIGTGTNRIVLYPVGGAYGERMTMAYFPERRLLYGADLVFKDQPTPAADLRRAVEREHLAVDSLFCVQRSAPQAWSDFYAATSR